MARRSGGEAEIQRRMAAAPGLTAPEAHALAGLLDAEGHFGMAPNNRDGWRCFCSISLRDDDRDVLIRYREKLGLGHLNSVPARNGSRAQVCWTITSKLECVLTAIEIFDRAPLLGRKWRQYRAWRPAAEAIGHAVVTRTQVDRKIVENGRSALARATAYRPPAHPMASDDAASAAREAYVDVLKRWAATTNGGLACTAYAAARRSDHPYWPKRETLAAMFGSWYDALQAAGLAERAVRRPSVL
jgi:hypothetical protein